MPERTFAEKPAKGRLEKRIEAFGDAKQRARESAIIMAEAGEEMTKRRRLKFEREGIVIRMKSIKVVSMNGHDTLCMIISARKNGGKQRLNNPFYFVNPPIKVGNGTFRKERHGNEIDVEVQNAEENPEEAIKQIVFDVVSSQIAKNEQ